MARAVAEAMDAGAAGLSTGLAYPTNGAADTGEVVALAAAAAARDGRLAMHLRDEFDGVAEAVREAFQCARQSGARSWCCPTRRSPGPGQPRPQRRADATSTGRRAKAWTGPWTPTPTPPVPRSWTAVLAAPLPEDPGGLGPAPTRRWTARPWTRSATGLGLCPGRGRGPAAAGRGGLLPHGPRRTWPGSCPWTGAWWAPTACPTTSIPTPACGAPSPGSWVPASGTRACSPWPRRSAR